MDNFNNLTGTSNINDKWLDNIYENIKKLEDYERLVREGCASLLDFMNIPINKRPVVIGITQFKNLRFLITEFRLLLADLTPEIDKDDNNQKSDKFYNTLDKIEEAIKYDRLFLDIKTDVNGMITEVKPRELFYDTLETLHKLKRDLFKEIKHILYINTSNGF